MKQFLLLQKLILETITINYNLVNHSFHYDFRKHFFCARNVNI